MYVYMPVDVKPRPTLNGAVEASTTNIPAEASTTNIPAETSTLNSPAEASTLNSLEQTFKDELQPAANVQR